MERRTSSSTLRTLTGVNCSSRATGVTGLSSHSAFHGNGMIPKVELIPEARLGLIREGSGGDAQPGGDGLFDWAQRRFQREFVMEGYAGLGHDPRVTAGVRPRGSMDEER